MKNVSLIFSRQLKELTGGTAVGYKETSRSANFFIKNKPKKIPFQPVFFVTLRKNTKYESCSCWQLFYKSYYILGILMSKMKPGLFTVLEVLKSLKSCNIHFGFDDIRRTFPILLTLEDWNISFCLQFQKLKTGLHQSHFHPLAFRCCLPHCKMCGGGFRAVVSSGIQNQTTVSGLSKRKCGIHLVVVYFLLKMT